jgi:hypothetical protein
MIMALYDADLMGMKIYIGLQILKEAILFYNLYCIASNFRLIMGTIYILLSTISQTYSLN